MTDSINLDEFIKQQTATAIENYVSTILDDIVWQRDFEKRVIEKINNRLTNKLSTMYQDPVVIQTIQDQMHAMITAGDLLGITNYIDHDALARKINVAIENTVNDTVQGITVEESWLENLERLVHQRMTDRLLTLISGINLNHLIKGEIDRGIDRWHDRLSENFHTRGIVDQANQCELAVMDGAVVAAHGLAAADLLIENSATIQGALTVNKLVVLGDADIDHVAFHTVVERAGVAAVEQLTEQWKSSLVQQVLDLARNQGIDFNEITISGVPIVSDGCLNHDITASNIKQLGNLESLTVTGPASLSDTVWADRKRVGINTREPESALTVWDEEVCVLIGKQQKNSAYIGTSRKQNLEIGVNRQAEIVVDDQGLTSIRKLRVDRWRIMFVDQVPGWSGTKGDLAINSNPNPKAPWAWQCLGGYKWNPLGSVA
jgi:hypothetical protein